MTLICWNQSINVAVISLPSDAVVQSPRIRSQLRKKTCHSARNPRRLPFWNAELDGTEDIKALKSFFRVGDSAERPIHFNFSSYFCRQTL